MQPAAIHRQRLSAEVLFNVRRRGLKRGDDYEPCKFNAAKNCT